MEKTLIKHNSLAHTNSHSTHHYPITSGEPFNIPIGWNHPEIHQFHSPIHDKWNTAIKTLIDLIISTFLIFAILSWLIPLLAIAIKLNSKGPVFFLQKRNMRSGKCFTCIKFRTMIVNEASDFLVATAKDERITRVGKFLRKYHIDELPQLFNVLKGEMSLIGPRPYMVVENLRYQTWFREYNYRHLVKPGITGLAQSYGYFGNLESLETILERVRLDVTYVKEWSLLMDVKITFRTACMLVRSLKK